MLGVGELDRQEALRRVDKGDVTPRAVVSANADRHAADLAEVIADIRGAGHLTLRAVTAELNLRGMLTRRGGQWHVSNVRNLLGRLEVPTVWAARASSFGQT